MYHIYVIETIIAEDIDDQLIGWKIPEPVEFINEMMNDFDKPGFAAIVLDDPIADMTDGANGKQDTQIVRKRNKRVDAYSCPARY